MKTLQSHLQGSSMQEMMTTNFQGSFNSDPKNKHRNANAGGGQGGTGGGGVKSDPKFAQATNKAQQIATIEQNMM